MMSPARIATALLVLLGITAGLHYYLWLRLVRDAEWPAPLGRGASWAVVGLAAAIPLALVASRVLPRGVASPLLWLVYVWMGVAFFLLMTLLPADLARGALRLSARLRGSVAPDAPARRVFLARLFGGAIGASALGMSGVGMWTALRGVAVKRVRVELAGLPAGLAGLTIVQLTDVHVGPTIGRDFIEELVAKTNALAPDVVAITGDLVDGSVAELGALVAPLRNLRARHGVYFVTGNHEYYSGAEAWLAYLATLGIRVLRNERVAIEHNGATLDLAGVDDWTARQFGPGHGADLPRALAGRDPTRTVVLLAHQPKAVLEAERLGVALVLSGHTHAGQMFPFNYLVRLQQPYVAGLHTHGRAKIYVSHGTGYWGPPMRLGFPAEITRIELARAA